MIVDQEFLVDQLKKDVPSFVRVVPLPKSGGVGNLFCLSNQIFLLISVM